MRYMMTLFLSIFLGVMLVQWLNSKSEALSLNPKIVTLIMGTFSFHGVALLLTNFLVREHEVSWAAGFGFSSPRLGRCLLLALVVGAATLPIVWSLGWLSGKAMTWFSLEPVVQETVQTLQTSVSLGAKILIGLFAIVVAPVAEEVVFRGILYPTVKQLGFPRLAFWGTSILFAAIHSNAMIFLPLTFLAVILTLLYESTNNLLAPIVTHSLFNFANFFWLVSQPAS